MMVPVVLKLDAFALDVLEEEPLKQPQMVRVLYVQTVQHLQT